ncbi:MAG TPA: hypothetical protein VFY03_12105 [Woeseiaceae bacterium]|nr:hypothetical protein [Woeseiaceae bacterium]
MRTLLLILLLALLAGWWWLRRRQRAPADERPRALPGRPATRSSEYHAVAIKAPAHACDAARRLEGKRYLASEAPRLPLPACDRDICECRFQHYEDRRSRRDRRSPFGAGGLAGGTGKFEQERRRPAGRREDDA